MSRRAGHKKQGADSEVNAIEKAHAREQGMELLSDVGDLVLKSLVEDVPVVGMVAKVLRGAQSVRNAHFMRKLSEFVQGAPEVSEEKRAAFLAKLDADPELRKKTMEHLVAVLDRLDDIEKAPHLARIFAALMAGQITPDEMRRFCTMLDRATLSDLRALRRFVEGGTDRRLTMDEFNGLEGIGLAAIQHSIVRPSVPGEVVGQVDFGGTDLLVVVNPTGKRFVEAAVVGREE